MVVQRLLKERRMPSMDKARYAVPGLYCEACDEPYEEKRITLALPRSSSGLAVIRNVPAEICPQCGEMQFSLRTTGRLMNVVRSDEPPSEVAVVPIYDLDRRD